MFHRVLVTDGGPHPPESWAQITVDDLMPLEAVPAQYRAQAITLRQQLLELLIPYHAASQADERQRLEANASEQLESWLADRNEPDFGSFVAEFAAIIKDTPWNMPWHGEPREVALANAMLTALVGGHTRQIRHIERMWHADRNPELPAGQRYRERSSQPATANQEA